MNNMTRQEIDEKLKIFFENNTPTFLKLKSERGYKVMNGFIFKINEEYIILKDIKLGQFPVLKSDILWLDVSQYKELNGVKSKE